MSAPALSSASTAAMRPSRAANSNAVKPAFDRAFRSAPRAMSASITGAYPSAAAHISAVCPRQPSLALGSAPRASSIFTASAFPVRAATISAVSPSPLMAPTSTPASSSIASVFGFPFTDASHSGVAPKRFAVFTLAPARISICTTSCRSRSTAQCNAVVPSACVAFTSTRVSISARTRAVSPALTASTIASCAPACAAPATTISAAMASLLYIERLEIRHASSAIDEGVQMHADLVEQRQMKVRQRRRVLVSDVAAALEPRASSTSDDDRQVRVIVDVGISHAAAEQIERVIEQRAVAIWRRLELLDQIREQRHMVRVDLGELHQLLRIVGVMRHRMMRLGHADVRVGSGARFPRQLERDDASHVSLERQHLQVEHQLDVVFPDRGNAGRPS